MEKNRLKESRDIAEMLLMKLIKKDWCMKVLINLLPKEAVEPSNILKPHQMRSQEDYKTTKF